MMPLRALAIIAATKVAAPAMASEGLMPDRLVLPMASRHIGITSYVDAGAARTWQIDDRLGLRVGPFLGMAYYGTGARHIGTRIGRSDAVVIGGLIAHAEPAFVTLAPNRADGRWGAILGLGLSIPLEP